MDDDDSPLHDRTPGVGEYESSAGILSYTVGLALAILATIASFVVSQTNLLWPPGIMVGLVVLAIAQIGDSSRLLSASWQRARSHEQYSGPRLWGADRPSRHRRLMLDHRQSQCQHDANASAISEKAIMSQIDSPFDIPGKAHTGIRPGSEACRRPALSPARLGVHSIYFGF